MSEKRGFFKPVPGPPVLEVPRRRAKRAFVPVLYGMYLANAAVQQTPERTNTAIERFLKLRKRGKGRWNYSGRVGKACVGQHQLCAPFQAKLKERFSIEADQLMLWRLLERGCLDRKDTACSFEWIDESAFWVVHPSPEAGRYARQFVEPLAWTEITDEHFARLVKLGSLSALTVLCHYVLNAPSRALALQAARFVPPLIALQYLDPALGRVAPIIYARLRQILLDDLSDGGRVLALRKYSIEAAMARADLWRQAKDHAQEDWVIQSLPALVRVERQSEALWAQREGPLRRLAQFKLHGSAIKVFESALGQYWVG